MTGANANRVFETPELLGNIYSYCSALEHVVLARTSRLAFGFATPRIWKTLDSVQPLLMLLSPQIQLSRTGGNADITLPSPSDFVRFNTYGSFVQQLTLVKEWNLGSKDRVNFRLCSWPNLALRVQIAPLLPNLRELTFTEQFKLDEELLLWVSTLIPPSLTVLNINVKFNLQSSSLANVLSVFALLTQKCAQLQTLRHGISLMSSSYPQHTSEQAALPQMALSAVALCHLETLQHLSCLSISGAFINAESLVALSRLPNLAELDINQMARRHNRDLPNILQTTSLSEESFPVLYTLRFQCSAVKDILAVWEVKAIVHNLTALYLKYESSVDEQFVSIFEEPVADTVLPLICERSPHLELLNMHGSSTDDILHIDSTLSPWSNMSRLPLRHVELGNFDADGLFTKGAHLIWPKVTHLCMPEQCLLLFQLVDLGRLPSLQQIRVNIEDFTEEIPQVQLDARSPLHTIEIAKPLLESIRVRSPEKVARFLLSIWPNLQKVVYKNRSQNVAQLGLELLNLHIRIIQGVAESKKNISMRYGPGVVASLLDHRLSDF